MKNDYSGLNLQGENIKRAINHDTPMWTPVLINTLPAVWLKHKEAYADLLIHHPKLFPQYKKPAAYKAPELNVLYKAGTFVDNWGCTWENYHDGAIGQVTTHPLADWDNFADWQSPDPLIQNAFGSENWDDLKNQINQMKLNGGFYPIIILPHGFHYLLLIDLLGYEKVMIDMAMGEPKLDSLISIITAYNKTKIKKLLDLGCEFLLLAEDLGMQDSMPMNNDMWRKYVKPGYEQTAGQARDRGIPVFLHSDGHILPIIDDLIETGVTIINPQVRANGLQGLKDQVKGKMTIAIDLDRQLFPFASEAQIEDHIHEVNEMLNDKRGGLMFNIEISDDIPLNIIEAIFTTVEKIANLPDANTEGYTTPGFF